MRRQFFLVGFLFLFLTSHAMACGLFHPCGGGFYYRVTEPTYSSAWYVYNVPRVVWLTSSNSYYYLPAWVRAKQRIGDFKFLHGDGAQIYYYGDDQQYYAVSFDLTTGEPYGIKPEGLGLDFLRELVVYYSDKKVRDSLAYYNPGGLELADFFRQYYLDHYNQLKPLPETIIAEIRAHSSKKTPSAAPPTPSKTTPEATTHATPQSGNVAVAENHASVPRRGRVRPPPGIAPERLLVR